MRTAALIATCCALLPAAGCNGTGSPGNGNAARLAPHLTFAAPPLAQGAPVLTAGEVRALFKLARLDPLKARDPAALRRLMKLPGRLFEEHKGYVTVTLHLPGIPEPPVGTALQVGPPKQLTAA